MRGGSTVSVTSGRDRRLLTLRLPTSREVVLVLLLISIYTQVPFYVTKTLLVPAFFTFLLVPVAFFMVANRLYRYDVTFLVLLFCVLLSTALLSPGLDFVGQKLLGLLLTMSSVVVGVLLLKLLSGIHRRRAAKILFGLSLILVAGVSLEVMGLLREASDSFREIAYSSGAYGVYDAPLRDANITGFERPNLFATEPSVLAKGFLAFVNAWLLISYSRKNLLVGLLMTSLLFVLTGSLVLIISIGISLAIALASEKRFLGLVFIFVTLPVGGGFLFALAPEVFNNAIARFGSVLSLGFNASLLTNDSIGLRLVLPALTLVNVWRNSPLFGVGISGKEVIGEVSGLPVSPLLAFGSNNLTGLLIYLGVVGTILFLCSFVWYFRKMRIRSMVLLFSIIAAFSLTGGGFEEPRFWGYVFLFVWAVKVKDETHAWEHRGKNSLDRVNLEKIRRSSCRSNGSRW